jgi:hypothetical protein
MRFLGRCLTERIYELLRWVYSADQVCVQLVWRHINTAAEKYFEKSKHKDFTARWIGNP